MEEERLGSRGRSQWRDEVRIGCRRKVIASSEVRDPAAQLEGGHREDQVRRARTTQKGGCGATAVGPKAPAAMLVGGGAGASCFCLSAGVVGVGEPRRRWCAGASAGRW